MEAALFSSSSVERFWPERGLDFAERLFRAAEVLCLLLIPWG